MGRSDITKYPGIAEKFAQLEKAINQQDFVATANQDTFTITNGSYAVGTKTLSVYIEGVLLPLDAYTEVNSTTFKLISPLNAGDLVTARWLEGKLPVAFGHKTSHEKGGQDELDITKLKGYTDNELQKVINTAKQPRPRSTGETDDTNRVSEVLANKGLVYFPAGIYQISKEIPIFDDTNVYCHPKAEFFLLANSRCKMFVSDKLVKTGNFYWSGGIINGNGANQGVEIEPDHDISRAFLLMNFYKVSVKNVLIKDIGGHAIGYWGNEYAYFRDIEFRQGLSPTHPYGGSRRDGITGVSRNIVIENITGFTDDDFIAICPGCDWAGSGNLMSVDNVFIRNIKYENNSVDSSFSVFRGLAVYSGGRGYSVKNLSITNVKGDVNTEFMRVFGYVDKLSVDNVAVNINNKSKDDVNAFIQVSYQRNGGGDVLEGGSKITELTVSGFTGSMSNATYSVPFLSVEISSTVEKLKIEDSFIQYKTSTAPAKSFLYVDTNSVIKTLDVTRTTYKLDSQNAYPFYTRNEASKEYVDRLFRGSNGKINTTYKVMNTTNMSRLFSLKLGYGTPNPSGSIKVNKLEVKKQGETANIVDLNSLTNSSSLNVTNNGDGTVTVTVSNPTHEYPSLNIPVNYPEATTYTVYCEYTVLSGNSELILEPRFSEVLVDKSSTDVFLTAEIKKENVTSGVDIVRSSLKDTKFVVVSNSLVVDTSAINKGYYNKLVNTAGNICEFHSGFQMMNKKYTLTVEKAGFTLAPNSAVWQQGGILFGNIVLFGTGNIGTFNANDFLVSFNRVLPNAGAKFELSSVTLTTDVGRVQDFFEFQYDQAGKTVIKASVTRSNIRWLTINFAYILGD